MCCGVLCAVCGVLCGCVSVYVVWVCCDVMCAACMVWCVCGVLCGWVLFAVCGYKLGVLWCGV